MQRYASFSAGASRQKFCDFETKEGFWTCSIAGSSNGRTTDSESVNLGSSPEASPPLAENPEVMYYVYVIQSISYNTRYVGVAESVERRLREHNTGRSRYTKGRRPWHIIYTEEVNTLSEARKREIFLKSGQGRKWLDENLGH